MRRTSLLALAAVAVLGIMLGGGGLLAASRETDSASHPAVGSWLVASDPGDAEFSPRLMLLSADGTALFVSGRETTGVGAWERAGDATATATFTVVTNGPAYIVIRASLAVGPDGQSFSGTWTIEAVFDPAGGGIGGEIGPGTLDGTRLGVDAPGTPIASFAEFFPPSQGSPEVTPTP